jgi:hypothetical protein
MYSYIYRNTLSASGWKISNIWEQRLSHPALGWLMVGYNVDTGSPELDLLPFSFSLYGCRLAIGYFMW